MKFVYVAVALGLVIFGVLYFKPNFYREYYDDGALKLEYYGNEGLPEGVLKEYYPTGELKGEACYSEGLQNGVTRIYYPTGTLHKEMFFKKGMQEDTMKVYYPNGNLQEISIIKNDLKNGFFESYYEYGGKMSSGWASNNLYDSLWTFYGREGLIDSVSTFDHNQLKSTLITRADTFEYRNIIHSYSISLSSKWSKQDEKGWVTLFRLNTGEKALDETINIVVQNYPDKISLKELVDNNMASMKSELQSLELVSTRERGGGILNDYKTQYKDINIRAYQFYIANNKMLYTITCVAEENAFSHFKDDFDRALSSFSFL